MFIWVTTMKRQWNWNVSGLRYQKLALALAAVGMLSGIASTTQAQQMRSSRGSRPLYPNQGDSASTDNKVVQRAKSQVEIQVEPEEEESEEGDVVQASTVRPRSRSNSRPSANPNANGQANRQANGGQANGQANGQVVRSSGNANPRVASNNTVRTTSGMSQRPQATQAVNRPVALPNGSANANGRTRGVGHAQAIEPIPQNAVADSGNCESCQSGGMMSAGMMSGDMMMGGGCPTCGSCDDMGCGCNTRIGNPCCIDFGSGPIASILSWGLSRSYLRFQASNFKPTGADLPILASTATPPTAANTVLGNNRVNGDAQIGYRFQAGIWLDACNDKAIEVHGYDAGSQSARLRADSTTVGANDLFRPLTGSPRVVLSQGTTRGVIDAHMDTISYGGAILLRNRLFQASNMRWDLLVGYQHARMEDYLTIASTSNNAGPGGTGQVSSVADRFNTMNRFDGMALGLQRFGRWGYWSLDTRLKLGLGNMRRTVEINGSELNRVGNAFVNANQGLLARETNAGVYVLDRFVVSPEFAIQLGYAVTRNLDFTIGYTYLGLPKVARAGDQIDVDASNIPETNRSFPVGNALPLFNLLESNYSLHSFDFGGQWRF